MGLKITRTKNPSPARPNNQSESSTLLSARYENEAADGHAFHPMITTEVRAFADSEGDLHDKGVKRLFDHLWKKLGTDERSDVVLDFSLVHTISPRFQRELGFLRRRVRHQGISVRLLNVSLPSDQKRLLDTV